MSARPPRLYFSFRSPYSWMAINQLEQHLPDAYEQIEYIPFFEPDETSMKQLEERGGEFHYVAMSKAKHLYILNDTKRLAQRFGHDLTWPVDVDPWWELPHLAWLKARQLGVERTFYNIVTSARWERGENICEEAVLEPLLRDAGLPAEELLAAPSDPEIRSEGVDALMRVYQDDVFGVPYIRWGAQKYWGIDRLADFLAVYRGETTAPPDLQLVDERIRAALGAYDHDTAGGCG